MRHSLCVCVLPGEIRLCIVHSVCVLTRWGWIVHCSLCYQVRLDCALFTVCVLPGKVGFCIVYCVCVTR